MSNISRSFLVRICTLILGAFSSFFIATLLLNSFGNEGYAAYVIFSSLPALIPFADFGLGSNVFNFFADRSEGRQAKNHVTEVFLLSFLISSIFMFVPTLIVICLFRYTDLLSDFLLQDFLLGLGIIGITFLAVPFSLAAKKLFAEEKITSVFFIQGLIPPITASLTFALLTYERMSLTLLFFIPSITYLITTLWIFWLSGISEYFAGTSLDKFRKSARNLLTLGGWSLFVTSVTALVWQAPKYLIQIFGTPMELTSYALMSLFLIPGLSLTAVSATWHTTKIRRRNSDSDVYHMTHRSIKTSQMVSVIFSISAFFGFEFLNKIGLVTPDYKSQIIAFLGLITSPLWMIPLAALTTKDDLKWIAIRIVPCFIFSSMVLSILLNVNYNFSLIAYICTLSASVRYFTNARLTNLQD
jgi:hypothetical protein